MKEVKFVVDKRTEIMSIMLYLSNYKREFPHLIQYSKDIPYVAEVYNHFSKFDGDKVIVLLNKIIAELSFRYDVPFNLASQLNEDLTVGKLLDFPFKTRLNSSPLVKEFLEEIKIFAERSKFDEFYNNHKKFYQDMIDKFKDMNYMEQLNDFEKFFKIDTKRDYLVYLMPLANADHNFYTYNDDFILFKPIATDKIDKVCQKANLPDTIFMNFANCLLRQIIENGDYTVPKSKYYKELIKGKFDVRSSYQHIITTICIILIYVYKKVFYNLEQAHIDEELANLFPENISNGVKKIYKLGLEWQKTDKPIDDYLQEMLNLGELI